MKINGVETEPEFADGKLMGIIRCDSCKIEKKVEIPDDVVRLMRKCGCPDYDIVRTYKEIYLSNPYFYCFCTFKCDICGEGRVLAWESGNSPAAHEVLWPSHEIRFWPNYDYPAHGVKICKFCMPDNESEASRDKYLMGLFHAMIKEEKHNWKWKKENKIRPITGKS